MLDFNDWQRRPQGGNMDNVVQFVGSNPGTALGIMTVEFAVIFALLIGGLVGLGKNITRRIQQRVDTWMDAGELFMKGWVEATTEQITAFIKANEPTFSDFMKKADVVTA